MDATERFVELVREYLTLIERADTMKPHAFLTRCSNLLPELYILGCNLPAVEPTYDENAKRIKPERQFGRLLSVLGKYHYYHYVFDPIYDENAGGSSLADDLSDIHADLSSSLVEYDAGNETNALWQWKFDMHHHAGEHLVATLRPIHFLIYDHMPWDYVAGESDSQLKLGTLTD